MAYSSRKDHVIFGGSIGHGVMLIARSSRKTAMDSNDSGSIAAQVRNRHRQIPRWLWDTRILFAMIRDI